MKKIFALATLALLFACSKKQITVPEDVIQKKDMQELLTDIHLAQSAATNSILSDSSIYSSSEYMNYVFKTHNVSREKFLSSMKFYTENPEVLEEVYDSVITELSRIQAESEVH